MDNLGICANCGSVGSCIFRSNITKPVWYCNDFLPSAAPGSISYKELIDETLSKDKIFLTDEYSGLCAYCGLKNDCLAPRKSGGIWHCNEFI